MDEIRQSILREQEARKARLSSMLNTSFEENEKKNDVEEDEIEKEVKKSESDEFNKAYSELFDEDLFEKAKHQIGDSHPTWPQLKWTDLGNGKFGWRTGTGRGKRGNAGNAGQASVGNAGASAGQQTLATISSKIDKDIYEHSKKIYESKSVGELKKIREKINDTIISTKNKISQTKNKLEISKLEGNISGYETAKQALEDVLKEKTSTSNSGASASQASQTSQAKPAKTDTTETKEEKKLRPVGTGTLGPTPKTKTDKKVNSQTKITTKKPSKAFKKISANSSDDFYDNVRQYLGGRIQGVTQKGKKIEGKIQSASMLGGTDKVVLHIKTDDGEQIIYTVSKNGRSKYQAPQPDAQKLKDIKAGKKVEISTVGSNPDWGTLNYLLNSGIEIQLRRGLSFKGAEERKVDAKQARESIEKNAAFDATVKNGVLHINTYSANDMM